MQDKIYYKQGYKYQLARDYSLVISISLPEDCILVALEFLSLKRLDENRALLQAYQGYAWDGCSGPTKDDKTNMRAGLVHDALYQLMRAGFLSSDARPQADKIFKQILKEDGMIWLRRFFYYESVMKLAGFAANPKNKKQIKIAP